MRINDFYSNYDYAFSDKGLMQHFNTAFKHSLMDISQNGYALEVILNYFSFSKEGFLGNIAVGFFQAG